MLSFFFLFFLLRMDIKVRIGREGGKRKKDNKLIVNL